MAADQAASEPGLNGFEVAVSSLHAITLAGISLVGAFLYFGPSLGGTLPFGPGGVDPILSLVLGGFLGWLAILLVAAAQRPPRVRLQPRARVGLVVSGIVTGFLAPVVLVVLFR